MREKERVGAQMSSVLGLEPCVRQIKHRSFLDPLELLLVPQ